MLEPLIFTDELIDLAVALRDEYFCRLDDLERQPEVIAEATLRSPVDASHRRTWLLGAPLRIAPAKTCLGLFKPEGKAADDGFTTVLDPSNLPEDDGAVTAALLHEITHVVDPLHDDDCRMRARNPELFRSSEAQYALASEQRAFTAMWTWHLRRQIAAGRQVDPREAMHRLRNIDPYFRGFLDLGSNATPYLWAQSEDHFRKIIAELERRQARQTPQ